MCRNKMFNRFVEIDPPYVQWVNVSSFPLLIDDPTQPCPYEVLVASSSLLVLFVKSFKNATTFLCCLVVVPIIHFVLGYTWKQMPPIVLFLHVGSCC